MCTGAACYHNRCAFVKFDDSTIERFFNTGGFTNDEILPVVGGQSLIDALHMLELTSVSPADFQKDEQKKNRDY